MFKVSSQEEFGLRFLIQLAKAGEREVSLSEIASKEGVSLAYVRKIFGILRTGGLVRASKGVLGGYSLIRPASQINLQEVFFALRNPEQDFSCSYFAGNLEICAHHGDCGVRPLVSVLNRKVDDFLLGISLSELVKEEREVKVQLETKANTYSENSDRELFESIK